ncbi:MAG: PAS domain-containing protein [Desulfobacteraceae bacterium]|jgi:PAS domain S-box-containing protein
MATASTPDQKTSKRVLIVESNNEFRICIEQSLNKAGFNAESVCSGALAIEHATGDPALVLLVTQTLSDHTADKVVAALSQRGIDVPFIVMKDKKDERRAVQMMQLGASDYLEKDRDLIDLLPLVLDRVFSNIITEKRLHNAEMAYGDTLWRLASIIEGANVGTWEWNVQTGETILNERWAQMAGYTLEQLAPVSIETWKKLTHPDDLVQATDLLNRHFAGELPYYSCDCRMLHKDGHWVWIRDHGCIATRDSHGKPLLMFGTHTDISDRKRVEKELEASRDLLEATQHLSKVGGWDWDVQSQQGSWTDETYHIHGLVPEETTFVPHELIELSLSCYDPDDRPVILEAFRCCTEQGVPYDLIFPFTTTDGRKTWIQTMARPVMENNRVIKIIGNIIDITERKLAEKAILSELEAQRKLDKVNTRVEYILNAIHDGLWENNFQTGEFYYSDKMFTMLGYSPISGQEGYDFLFSKLYPGDSERLNNEVQLLASGQTETWNMDFRMQAADGSWRNILSRGNCVTHDSQGQGYHFAGVHTDITDLKQTEEALRDSEEKHRTLVKGLPDIVMRFDRDIRPLYVSENIEDVTGIPASKFIGKTCLELNFPEEACASWTESVQHVFDSEVSYETEYTFDGVHGETTFNRRLIPERDADGRVQSVLSISRDITAHRMIERDYQTLFREMLDGFALHEIICDDQGKPVDYRFLAVNPAFERMTGLESESLIGKTVLEIMPGTEPYWIETYGKVALTGEPVFFENHSREVGKFFEVTAFRPATNQFACIFADITDRKQAEEEKEKLQAQLNQAQKMESVGRLAGGVAHDFNNMMGVILGHVEMILYQMAPTQPIYADIQEIQKAAQRSADLTRQLLAFARKQTVALKVLDLNGTVEGMLKMLRRLIGEDIHLEWMPGRGQKTVMMDPTQLDQILVNLCVNARDALGSSGKIIIRTAGESFDQTYCDTHLEFEPGEYVMLSVSDNGCGMDQETVARLFEPFFTTKEIGKGTGLGLSTVYGIVKQNNGFIIVHSEKNKGTTFKIYLPLHVPKAEQMMKPDVVKPVEHGSETILLVEDEPAILSMTALILKRLGYMVLAAATPGEAMRLAERHPGEIHMLMTDVVMPEMNGRDLAKNILDLYPNMKRLFMSGYTADVIAHHGVLDKGVNFIQKPFSIKDLSEKIRAILKNES